MNSYLYALLLLYINTSIRENESDHKFYLKNSTFIEKEDNLLRWKCIGSALNVRSSTINLSPASYIISSFLADNLLCRILNTKSDKKTERN